MRYLLHVCLASLFFIACQKSKDEPKSNAQLLVNKWKFTGSSERTKDGTIIPDTFNQYPDFLKDDHLHLKDDGTYAYYDNALKRPGNTKEVLDYGRWKLTIGQQLELESMANNTHTPQKLVEINSSTMKLELGLSDGSILWGTYTAVR